VTITEIALMLVISILAPGVLGAYAFGWWWRGRFERQLEQERLERAMTMRDGWREAHPDVFELWKSENYRKD